MTTYGWYENFPATENLIAQREGEPSKPSVFGWESIREIVERELANPTLDHE